MICINKVINHLDIDVNRIIKDITNLDKQPTIRYAFGNPLYRWSFASAAVFPDQEVALVI